MRRKLRISEGVRGFSRCDWLTDRYATVVRDWPSVVLLVSGLLAAGLVALAYVHYRNHPPDWDPKRGFEARHTSLSQRRLAYHLIRKLPFHLKTGRRRPKPDDNRTGGRVDNRTAVYTRRYPRDTTAGAPRKSVDDGDGAGDVAERTSTERSAAQASDWAEHLAQIYLSSPCLRLQYNQSVQAAAAKHLVKVVHRAESVRQLLSLDGLLELCHLADGLNYSDWHGLIAYTGGLSLPQHLACAAKTVELPAYNCSFLTQGHVDELEAVLRTCAPHRADTLRCMRMLSADFERGDRCLAALPAPCNEHLVADMFWYFLPNDLFATLPNGTEALDYDARPVYVNSFLPPFTYYAYRYRKRIKTPPTVALYADLREQTANYSKLMKHWRLVGMRTQTKLEEFNWALNQDFPLGILSCLVVLSLIALYTGSPLYTAAIAMGLVYSIAAAYVLYTFVFGIDEFGFMNLLVFVLLIGIGADDAFVLQHLVNGGHRDRNKADAATVRKRHRSALAHAALSMLVTSATTAAAFFANSVSRVVCIRCFGVFAGCAVLANYAIAVTWLPASLALADKTVGPLLRRTVRCIGMEEHNETFQDNKAFIAEKCSDALSSVIYALRHVWAALGSCMIIASVLIIFWKPGFSLPVKNPLQVFRDDHLYEWHDNNVEALFPYASSQTGTPLWVKIIVGFEPDTWASFLNTSDNGTLRPDAAFNLSTVSHMSELLRLRKQFRRSRLITGHRDDKDTPSWIERFYEWSRRKRCLLPTRLCCNVSDPYFKDDYLRTCVVHGARSLGRTRRIVDYPVFAHNTGTSSEPHMQGYVIEFESNHNYSAIYGDMDDFFRESQDVAEEITSKSTYAMFRSAWFTSGNENLSKWYDLLSEVVYGTPVAIGLSIGCALVVVVCTSRTLVLAVLSVVSITGTMLTTMAGLVLLQWRVHLVESTIIVLNVGLSFDYTLHYAVAYKLAGSEGPEIKRRIARSLCNIGGPVSASALTTMAAGACLIPSRTLAFHQIGTFMVLTTALSYLYATFYFLAIAAAADGLFSLCGDNGSGGGEHRAPKAAGIKLSVKQRSVNGGMPSRAGDYEMSACANDR